MPSKADPSEEYRRVRRLETDWYFHRGDTELGAESEVDEEGWKHVEIPHDWSIQGPFDPDNPGGQAQGFAPGGVGWYRRRLPEDIDGNAVLRFDGVYRNFDVYLDGEHIGHRPYGYSTVTYDLGDFDIQGGETLAVRVDNDEYPHSRWYTGSGIYRNVYLIETNPVSVVPFGSDVRTTAVNHRRAEIRVLTEVGNAEADPVTCRLKTDIISPGDRIVATVEGEGTLAADGTHKFDQTLSVADPERWTLENPQQYFTHSTVYRDGEAVDDYVTPFGIRTFDWTADAGFFLNGDPVTLKGVCLHHDAGCLGAAVPKRALERRLETLQKIGCNAIRTAHNPPQPELLELCDRMGFLVIDELYDKWRHEGAERWFEEWWREDLEAMIERDRNHPSIVCWSVGNENYDQGESDMIADLSMLTEAASEMDPTRPVTYANIPVDFNIEEAMETDDSEETTESTGSLTVEFENLLEDIQRVAEHVDVLSCNYQEHWYDEYREAGIDLPIVGSESRPYFRGSGENPLTFLPQNPWYDAAEKEFVCGQFIWAGVDYLGEAREWPSKGWAAGLIDTTGAIKPFARFHQAAWSEDPTVFAAVVDHERERPAAPPQWSGPPLSAHWNFPDRENPRDFVNVYTFTNAEYVELYQNERFLGAQSTDDANSRPIEWYVPYETGTLRAVATEDGEVVAEHELKTAGDPEKINLEVDRESISADGRDLVYVRATVTDGAGVRVHWADHEIRFKTSGQGSIVGVDNGNLDSAEPWVGETRSAYRGTCIAVVQAGRETGAVEITGVANELADDSLTVAVEDSD